jgi:hypothetical protein
MFVADGAQPSQESQRSRDVTAFAQHGLDDDRRGVRRCRLPREQQFQLVKRGTNKLGLVRSRSGAEMMPIRGTSRCDQRSRLAEHPVSDKEN